MTFQISAEVQILTTYLFVVHAKMCGVESFELHLAFLLQIRYLHIFVICLNAILL